MAIKTSPVDMDSRRKLDIRPGDTVRVVQKIEEKGKQRLQTFEGLVLAKKHGREAGGTFTVRRVLSGVGVEKIFPLFSPMIDKIEIVKRSKVRRAKLYFIREKASREARRLLRRSRLMAESTEDFITPEQPIEAAPAEAEIPAPETGVEKEVVATAETEANEEKAEEKAQEASAE